MALVMPLIAYAQDFYSLRAQQGNYQMRMYSNAVLANPGSIPLNGQEPA